MLVANHRKKKNYDWVVNERAKGMRISTVRVLQESKRIAQEDKNKGFQGLPILDVRIYEEEQFKCALLH
jgi:hypothetical protein